MKKLLAFLILALVSSGAMAGTKPFNLSLTPDVALCDRSDTIEGMTLSVWGENPQSSFALGIANGTVGQSVGFGLGVLNYSDDYKGLQWGVVNYTKKNALGWQGFLFGGFVNYTYDTITGLQTGVVNYGGLLKGVQFGLVNYASDADDGVQIGLINVMPKNQWFSGLPNELAPGMIFVNWRF